MACTLLPRSHDYLRITWLLRKDKDTSECLSVVSFSFQSHGLYSPWNSPDWNTGVGRCSLLQGISPTQESNPALLHCRQILYQVSYLGSPLATKDTKRAQFKGHFIILVNSRGFMEEEKIPINACLRHFILARIHVSIRRIPFPQYTTLE